MLDLFFSATGCNAYYFYANVPDNDAALFYTLKKLNLNKKSGDLHLQKNKK